MTTEEFKEQSLNKNVFYLREDVRAEIQKVKDSEVIKQMVDSHRKE